MSDRILVPSYSKATSQTINNLQQNQMVALGDLYESIYGNGVTVAGLTVHPTSPASLAVTMDRGTVSTLSQVDTTAPGSGSANSNTVLKIGTLHAPTNITFSAPSVTGYSVNYLIEVAFNETDTNPQTLSYIDPTTGTSYTGNTSVNTARIQTVSVQVKAGTAALAGTQTTPVADSGYTPLYIVTVNNGQTQILSNNIVEAANVPWAKNRYVRPTDLTGVYETVAHAANTYVSVANTSASAIAGTVPVRDGSGGLTAAAFHGNADSASTASSANFANTSAHAYSADSATFANTAAYATTAGSASSASTATNATNASYATTAATANNSTLFGGFTYATDTSPSTMALRDAGGNLSCVKLYGEAVQADFADLGEKFAIDTPAPVGSVVQLGGPAEITLATNEIFGVISGNPAFRMNANAGDDDNFPFVAHVGRVDVLVQGTANKFDFLVLSTTPGVAVATPVRPLNKKVIGRVLQDKTDSELGLVLAVVRMVL